MSRHSRTLSVPFVVAIYGLLAFRMVQDWDTLGPTLHQARYDYLALSCGLLFIALGIAAGRWFVTLRALEVKIGWWESLRVWFLSQAGRYIPGSIWPYVGRMYWGAGTVPSDKMVGSLALEIIFRVSSETGLAAFLLLLWVLIAGWGERWGLMAAAFAVAVAVGHALLLLFGPRVYRWLTPVLQTKIPGWAGLGGLSLTRASMCGQWLYYSASVCAVGVAFYFFVSAFHPLEIDALLPLTGSLAAATVIGFLVPLAPNGWGVREGILVFMLAQFVPTSVAVMVSVTSRIWLALAEALWVILLVALARLFRTTAPATIADRGYVGAGQSRSEDYHEISEES